MPRWSNAVPYSNVMKATMDAFSNNDMEKFTTGLTLLGKMSEISLGLGKLQATKAKQAMDLAYQPYKIRSEEALTTQREQSAASSGATAQKTMADIQKEKDLEAEKTRILSTISQSNVPFEKQIGMFLNTTPDKSLTLRAMADIMDQRGKIAQTGQQAIAASTETNLGVPQAEAQAKLAAATATVPQEQLKGQMAWEGIKQDLAQAKTTNEIAMFAPTLRNAIADAEGQEIWNTVVAPAMAEAYRSQGMGQEGQTFTRGLTALNSIEDDLKYVLSMRFKIEQEKNPDARKQLIANLATQFGQPISQIDWAEPTVWLDDYQDRIIQRYNAAKRALEDQNPGMSFGPDMRRRMPAGIVPPPRATGTPEDIQSGGNTFRNIQKQ